MILTTVTEQHLSENGQGVGVTAWWQAFLPVLRLGLEMQLATVSLSTDPPLPLCSAHPQEAASWGSRPKASA
jgi:hypothetical protein